MSVEAAMNFVQQVAQDPNLRETFLQSKTPEEAAALGSHVSLSFTAAHLHEAVKGGMMDKYTKGTTEDFGKISASSVPTEYTDYVPKDLLTKKRPSNQDERTKDEKSMINGAVRTLESLGDSKEQAQAAVSKLTKKAAAKGDDGWQSVQSMAKLVSLVGTLFQNQISDCVQNCQTCIKNNYGKPTIYLPKHYIKSHLTEEVNKYEKEGDSKWTALQKASKETVSWINHKARFTQFSQKLLKEGTEEHCKAEGKTPTGVMGENTDTNIPLYAPFNLLEMKKPSGQAEQTSSMQQMRSASLKALEQSGIPKNNAEFDIAYQISQNKKSGMDEWQATKSELIDANKTARLHYKQQVNAEADKMIDKACDKLNAYPTVTVIQSKMAMADELKKSMAKYENEGYSPKEALEKSQHVLDKYTENANHNYQKWKAKLGAGVAGSKLESKIIRTAMPILEILGFI